MDNHIETKLHCRILQLQAEVKVLTAELKRTQAQEQYWESKFMELHDLIETYLEAKEILR